VVKDQIDARARRQDTLDRLASEILLACYDRLGYESNFLKKSTLEEVLKVGPTHGHQEARASAALARFMRERRQLVTGSTADSRRGTKCGPQRLTWRRIVERKPNGCVEPLVGRTAAVVVRDTWAVGVPSAGLRLGAATLAANASPRIACPKARHPPRNLVTSTV